MRHHLFLLLLLLPFLALSCGELELPQKDTVEQDSNDNDNDNDKDDGDSNDDNDDDGNGDNDGDQQTGQAIDFGRACLTADGHLLIDDRLYLSLEEFWYVSSATGTKPTEAQDYAAAYSEGDLKGWRIPTADDVTILRDALACKSPYYGKEQLTQINKVLSENDLPGIYRERYLCDGATQTFDFVLDSKLSAAGKSKTYLLRLVRDK